MAWIKHKWRNAFERIWVNHRQTLAMVIHPIPVCDIGRMGGNAQSPAWNIGGDRCR
jgi:hypothetical protein